MIWSKFRIKLQTVPRSIYALAGIIGYILSPASWWNDAVVNIPLALVGAEILWRLLHIPLDAGFAISYWVTNILGIIMMLAGAEGAMKKRVSKKSVIMGLLLSTVYTIIVVLGIRLLT